MGKIGKKTSKSLLFVILFCSILTGCQKSSQEEVSCVMPISQNVSAESEIKNSQLDISVNVDGSDSMLGYVTIPNNNYMRTLELIANTFIDTNNTEIEYKRIGDEKILTRNDFRKDATSRIFYDSNNGKYKPVSSPIQSAIVAPVEGKDKLTLIITDLEGDDGGKIAEELAKNYLNQDPKNQGYTVGIWAVKSQFNGTIFDPNTGKIKSNYSTEGKKLENYRPFYVLFIGKYEQIANYFDELKKLDSQLEDSGKMFIFPTNNILKEPVNLGTISDINNNSQLPENNQLQRVFGLEDKNVVVTLKDQKNEPYDLLDVVDNTEPQLTITYQVSFPQLATQNDNNYSLFIAENNLKTKTKVFTFSKNNQEVESETKQSENNQDKEVDNKEIDDKKESDNKKIDQKVETEQEKTIDNNEINSQLNKVYFKKNSSNSLQQALTIKDLKLDEKKQNLEFVTNLNLNNLSTPQIYLFEVDLILDDIIGLDWWNEWSSNSNNQNFDGSKTQNFSIFMNKLKSLSLASLKNEDNNVLIGRFCFGIQKN